MKYLIAILAAVFLVSVVTRARAVRRLFHVILAVLALYAVLKMTGVIEAIQPKRSGVTGYLNDKSLIYIHYL